MLVRKSQLRAELELEAARIAEAIPTLNATELAELKELLANEVADIGTDAREQVEREAALAASTKAMNVKLSREASRALQAQMMRRLEHGHCPAPAPLVGEAVAKAFAGGRP